MEKRGQVSIEFITIFGFVFLMMIPLIVIFFDQSGAVQDAIASNHLRNIGIKIIDKGESVYYLGEPSKVTIKTTFPERIEYINFTTRTILIGYRTQDNNIQAIEVVAKMNVTGSLSTNPGIHYISIEASSGGITVSDA